MDLVYWPIDENAGADYYKLNTLRELWEFVRQTPGPIAPEPGVEYVRELSANEGEDGEPYLVLSWVPLEASDD